MNRRITVLIALTAILAVFAGNVWATGAAETKPAR